MNTDLAGQVQPTSLPGEKDVNASVIGLVGFIGALIVFAIIILLQVIYYAWVARVEARNRTISPEEIINVRTEQQMRLNAVASGPEAGGGVLPIERAMRLVVEDVQKGRPTTEIGGQMTPTTPAGQAAPGSGKPAEPASAPETTSNQR